jgi:prepilin-type processing-associated H-X9-DG protein
MQCANNLKQIGLALLNYHEVRGVFPYAAGDLGASWGWSAFILPYMEADALHSQINFNFGYNAPDSTTGTKNNQWIKTLFPVYQCPSADPNRLVTCCIGIPGEEDVGQTDYSAIATHTSDVWDYTSAYKQHSGVMYLNSTTRLDDIKDGSSNTFLVGEVIGYPDDAAYGYYGAYCPNGKCIIAKHWAAENRVSTYLGINGAKSIDDGGVASRHSNGAQFLFADGHVSFISQNVDQATLVALTTRGPGKDASGTPYGGETIQAE